MKPSFLSFFSLTVLLFLQSQTGFAAACCGGGFAAPSVIAGDDKAQISTSYAFSEVVVDNVDSQGIWRQWDEHQKVQTFRIEGAHIVTDRWQAGFVLPVVQRSRLGESYSGIGDAAASLGYEYLPDWDYSPYRPKGIGFLTLTLPTGKARAESEIGGLDSRGSGFLSLGIGTLLLKSFAKWDALTSFEIHRSFSKAVDNSQIQGRIEPGFGGNFGMGGGYNWKDWRLGTLLTWTYEDAIQIRGQSFSEGSIERFATAQLAASYLANEQWAGTLSYSDQTLFGSPVNTSLGKTAAFSLQRRWGR